jgi:hypothetical protein
MIDVMRPRVLITCSRILAIVIDVPINRFLGNDLKPNAFVFHVRRQFHTAQGIGLPNL